LRMPGVGYTREHQESFQELSRLWLAYEQAYGEYAAYSAETTRRSLNRLRENLIESFEQGEGPSTIRDLYDNWVSCSEDTYAERVATEEYRHLNARMINALMAYRSQAAKIMDQWAEAANLPTRDEVDALHRKLKETRQELSALKSRLAEAPASPVAGRRTARSAAGTSARKPGARPSRKPAARSGGKSTGKQSGKQSGKSRAK
ncbi:MAG: class III poly(R)-hydroxyalkanoic acid synthase subunit PhaE, partial [Arenicellales bacterium]